ncbi:MAG TPA: cyclic pyranopterin monophosphate synthase MoaC [Acidimicrobiia bacterium]|nr:cyclic pyranopterin monophosphate synthase MoaC [Acidimicrobiia bacterium]
MSSEIRLPHLTPAGDAHMIDVSTKDVTQRTASAEAIVALADTTAEALFGGTLPKGDALAAIRLAGIMGAKRTAELIPLCHPLPIDAIEVSVTRVEAGARIVADVTTTARTGVEMEAMTAASIAAITLYDMVKGIERGVEITSVRLLRKTGGRSGTWER